MNVKRFLTGCLSVFASSVLIATAAGETASGIEYTWTGEGDGTNWNEAVNWSPNGVPGADDSVLVTAGSVYVESSVSVASLKVDEGASIYVNATGSVYMAVSMSDARSELKVLGSVTNSGSIVVGGLNNAGGSYVTIGGDLVMGADAVLSVYAGHTSDEPGPLDYMEGGGALSVTGDIVLKDNSQVYPCVAPTWGMPVVISADDVDIGPSAGIDSTHVERIGGPNGKDYVFSYGWESETAPGYWKSNPQNRGGSYAGLGGGVSDSAYLYGYANAPFYAGSPGYLSFRYGLGGGVIRLDCNRLLLAGRLKVKGGDHGGITNAGGSGGSIWITCASIEVAGTAVMDASGGGALQHSSCSGGGGGRIAIFDGSPSKEQITSLYTTGECSDYVLVTTDFTDLASPVSAASTTVSGGVNIEKVDTSTYVYHGKPGTTVYMSNTAGKHVLTVTGSVETADSQPAYGVYTLAPGPVEFKGVEYVYDPQDSRKRIPCRGYTWSDANGRYASGEGLEATVDIVADTQFTWLYGARQYRFDVCSGGNGRIDWDGVEWRDQGTSVTLAAVADDGAKFLYWVGDIDPSQRFSSSITVNVDAPRSIVACFESSAPRTLQWCGEGDGIDWFDPANWDGGVIPGQYDSVSITSGTPAVLWPCDIKLASLSLSGSARLYFGATPSIDEVKYNNIIKTYISYPAFTGSEGCSLSVSGGLSLSESSAAVCGGWGSNAEFDLDVGGSLALSGTSRLFVYAGYKGSSDDIETFYQGGARVDVGGDFTVADNAVFYPCCDFRSGAPVVTKVGRLFSVASSASVNADYRGWGHDFEHLPTGYIYTYYGLGYPGPVTADSRIGGSYGGESIGNDDVNVYGSEYAPYYPGSPGSASQNQTAYQLGGGGAIRVHASKMQIDGTLTANGFGVYQYAGGSGGGVFLTARSVVLGPGAKLSARGGDPYPYADTAGGGGGRIAIALKISVPQIRRLYEQGRLPGIEPVDMTADGVYSSHVDVGGGKGRYPGNTGQEGESGTAVIYTVSSGMRVIVR